MPALTKRKSAKPDPNVTYVCAVGHSGEHVGYPEGTELRGDHPAVLANPQFFVPFGTPRSEWPNAFSGIVAGQDAQEAEQARNNKIKLTPPAGPSELVCVADYVSTIDGLPVTIQKGSRLLEGDREIESHPAYWTKSV
jgi:hypothetical protein